MPTLVIDGIVHYKLHIRLLIGSANKSVDSLTDRLLTCPQNILFDHENNTPICSFHCETALRRCVLWATKAPDISCFVFCFIIDFLSFLHYAYWSNVYVNVCMTKKNAETIIFHTIFRSFQFYCFDFFFEKFKTDFARKFSLQGKLVIR